MSAREEAEKREKARSRRAESRAGAVVKDEEKEKFKNSLKKLHGAKLHVAVLNAIGVKTEDMTPEAIRGAFKAQHQIANAMKGKVKPVQKVAGQKMFQNTGKPAKTDNMETLRKMGFPMPAA